MKLTRERLNQIKVRIYASNSIDSFEYASEVAALVQHAEETVETMNKVDPKLADLERQKDLWLLAQANSSVLLSKAEREVIEARQNHEFIKRNAALAIQQYLLAKLGPTAVDECAKFGVTIR